MKSKTKKLTAEFILRHLIPPEGLTANEVASKSGLTFHQVGWVAKKLIAEGVIIKEQRFRHAGSYVIYFNANL
jgi:predicted transcriptional regulator